MICARSFSGAKQEATVSIALTGQTVLDNASMVVFASTVSKSVFVSITPPL
ncbi:hypothetical protein O9929_25545 [Vibrio lentus]|nr:hypothetical protein [Vibrio lentus]